MAEPLKSDDDGRPIDSVTKAWDSAKTPPDLTPFLRACDSSRGQLEILLADLRQRHRASISADLQGYLSIAPLVARDENARLELLENEFLHCKESGSQQELERLLEAYPELQATQWHRSDEPSSVVDHRGDPQAATFDTVIENLDPQHPTPRVEQRAAPIGSHGDFGRYEILRVLGKGGFGTVYLASDPQLDRQVAIKSLHKGAFNSDRQRRDFLEEVRSTARLNHPAIVTLYDVAESSDGTLFAVMEYVDGEPLADRLNSREMELAEGIEILVQVAQALSYGHRRGFVHRDLKPANILVDREGRARVADFGLAIHEDTQRGRAGELAGTPAYMSPEQVRGETHLLDGRTDIWSFGVLMYEMLTERLPFSGDSVKELFDEILHRRPRPPRQINADILPELDGICRRCLAPNVEHRYGNAEDLAIDLDRCLPALVDSKEVSIASHPALIIAGIAVLITGFGMSFVGGFFVWVTYMAMQWAFGGLNSTAEYVAGVVVFGLLSSPFFLGLPVMILGLWLAVVQGLRWRGRTQYTSGKAVAALAMASLTPLLNLFAAVPTAFFAWKAFREIAHSPRVKGRVLASTAVCLAIAGTLFSTWMIARGVYLYTAFQAVDRGQIAIKRGRYDDAVFETRLATTRYPALAIGWRLRGEALVASGKPRDAVDALTQAINFYTGVLQNETTSLQQSLFQARTQNGTHNLVFQLSECYRLRGIAHTQLGNQQLADADVYRDQKFRAHTYGRLFSLFETFPPRAGVPAQTSPAESPD